MVFPDVIHEVGVVRKTTIALAALESRYGIVHAPVHSEGLCRAKPLPAHIAEMHTSEVAGLDVIAQQARGTAGKHSRTILADQCLAVNERRWLSRMLLAKVINKAQPTRTRCTTHLALLFVVVFEVVVVDHVGRLTRLTTQLTRPVAML